MQAHFSALDGSATTKIFLEFAHQVSLLAG